MNVFLVRRYFPRASVLSLYGGRFPRAVVHSSCWALFSVQGQFFDTLFAYIRFPQTFPATELIITCVIPIPHSPKLGKLVSGTPWGRLARRSISPHGLILRKLRFRLGMTHLFVLFRSRGESVFRTSLTEWRGWWCDREDCSIVQRLLDSSAVVGEGERRSAEG